MNKWPKLSETLRPVVDLTTCQNCGGKMDDGDPDFLLARWQEHDERDNPTNTVVLLCKKCSDEIIEPHPRLYGIIHNWAPLPGSMPTCNRCVFREGVSCRNPLLKSNGGPGLPMKMPKPSTMFVDGRDSKGKRFGYQMLDYKGPVVCEAREVNENAS